MGFNSGFKGLTNVAQLDGKDPKLCRQSLTHNVGLVR